MTPLLVGGGAGFSGDRIDAPIPVVAALAASGRPSAIIFETLAERTLALAQRARAADAERGYEPALEALVAPILKTCLDAGIRIVGNFGAANPRGAAAAIHRLAAAAGLRAPRIAIVEGDDLLAVASRPEIAGWTADMDLGDGTAIVSANTYLGAREIAEALAAGAEIVVTGRVADPALVLGPVMAHFGWAWDDWDRLAFGTAAGHLLECGAQVTGGYFADPGMKDVPGLAECGFPIAEIADDGTMVVTKPEGTGGIVSTATVTEQLLYEIHDPAAYLTPDVVLDVTAMEVEAAGRDRVRVSGARGRSRPETLKATVCIAGGFLGEAEISYAGPHARERARLAAEIVRERLSTRKFPGRMRFDLIGVASVFNDDRGSFLDGMAGAGEDVRMRLAVNHDDRARVEAAIREVLSLYCCGPAGGGGVRQAVTPVFHTASAFVPRAQVRPSWRFVP
ncbi:MAG: acyclic terpene utilization AtuA family protein [Alphaproteobacteria bacterium]